MTAAAWTPTRRAWHWSTGRGGVVRAWRISSPTIIQMLLPATPALVDGDPVIVLEPYSGPPAHRLEYLVLRLGPRGGIRTRFSLPKNDPPRSAFGNFAITDIRVEPDGKLYQLGSSPDFGAAVYRFSFAPSEARVLTRARNTRQRRSFSCTRVADSAARSAARSSTSDAE